MKLPIRNIFLLVVMLCTSAVAIYLRPNEQALQDVPTIDLQKLIPDQFGHWTQLPNESTSIVNPQQQEDLERIYSQLFDRSYRDSETGRVVMLSIAYGAHQTKQSQVHRPEVCYPAQGFQIVSSSDDRVSTKFGFVPVRRLVARLAQRNEPITYWIRVGDQLTRGWMEQKLASVIQGFSGSVADGVLVRLSTIDDDSASSYEMQNRFIADLLTVLSPPERQFLIGRQGS